MAASNQKIGWIGMGRMGFSMAERLVKAGYDLSVWNRTKSKAEPLAKSGAKIVDTLADLAGVDVLFSIVSAGPDLDEVYFGKHGVVTTGGNKLPKIFVDCSTIAVEESVEVRKRLKERGSDFICAPVSGNAKVIKAGKLSSVVLRPGSGVPHRRADDQGVRAARRLLRRRGRARARVQDRAQRHARRGDREPDRDHAAGEQAGRAAPRLPVVPQQRRDGLDVHRLQVAGAGQSRLDHHLHARAPAQGPRPRPRDRPARRTCRCR